MKIEATTGKLIFEVDQDNLRFEDSSGRVYDYTKLIFLSGRWRTGEGNIQYPGVEIREGGTVKIGGDTILAMKEQRLFRDSVVILGSLRNLNYDNGELLKTSADVSDFDKVVSVTNNDRRMMICQEDGEGNLLFLIEAKIERSANATIMLTGSEKNTGNLYFTINGGLEIKLLDKNNGFVSELQIVGGESPNDHKIVVRDRSQNKIQIDRQGIQVEDANQNKIVTSSTGMQLESPKKGTLKGKSLSLDAEKIKIGKGDELRGILESILDAIQKMTFNTGPQGSPTIPQPINWAEFESVKSRISRFLSE